MARRLSRRRFLHASGVAAAGAAMAPALDTLGLGHVPWAGASGSGPNIVWICTDDQRFDETWVMSKSKARVFNQSTQFTSFMTSRPVCQPSRASFITGQY